MQTARDQRGVMLTPRTSRAKGQGPIRVVVCQGCRHVGGTLVRKGEYLAHAHCTPKVVTS